MFTSLRETTPASEYANPPSKSFVFKDSSINDGGYFVSRIWAGKSDCIEKITSALQKYASILREIDKVGTISGGSSNQLQLGSVILSSDYLEPYKSQLPKSHSFLTQNSGLGEIVIHSATAVGAIDSLLIKESDLMEGVERTEGDWAECNCN